MGEKKLPHLDGSLEDFPRKTRWAGSSLQFPVEKFTLKDGPLPNIGKGAIRPYLHEFVEENSFFLSIPNRAYLLCHNHTTLSRLLAPIYLN